MKKSSLIVLLVFALSAAVLAQSNVPQTSSSNSRVVTASTLPPPQPKRTPVIVVGSAPATKPTPSGPGVPVANSNASNLTYKGLSFAQIKSKISEAKRQMQTRPLTTASVEPMTLTNSFVRIAYYDKDADKIEYFVLSKESFLTPNVLTTAISSNGRSVTSRTLRANGVNTPVVVTDDRGRQQVPLLVQYPVEKFGRYVETAYYMSTHPGLVTPEVVSAGRLYVRNTIDIAREQLKSKGYLIQPKVADIAEHLAAVEHVDHLRFRTEFHPNIYNDIYTLFALNEGQTYRYSVSSAGAGGMVQMIPSTYRMVRNRHPNALLMPDFVEGMRNHVNAAQAMLLYMQMTWNDLIASPTVLNAYSSGIATQEQLMAAGYNSNPARLAGYINRGGANWTSLIPRETQVYLRIYDSLTKAVHIEPRKL